MCQSRGRGLLSWLAIEAALLDLFLLSVIQVPSMIHRLQFGLLKCEDFRRDVSSRGRGLPRSASFSLASAGLRISPRDFWRQAISLPRSASFAIGLRPADRRSAGLRPRDFPDLQASASLPLQASGLAISLLRSARPAGKSRGLRPRDFPAQFCRPRPLTVLNCLDPTGRGRTGDH